MKKSGADRLKESKERKKAQIRERVQRCRAKKRGELQETKKTDKCKKKKDATSTAEFKHRGEKKELPIKLNKLYLLLLRKGRQCFQQCWKVQQHARL